MDELKKLLMATVPLIGNVIGTASPIAGILFSAIAHMFGLNTGATADQVASAISSDPDHDIKLKQLEITHADAILDAATQIRMGAYEREETILKSGKRDWLMDFLSIFIVMSFMAMCLIVAFVQLPHQEHDIFYMLLGAVAGGWSVILNYYYGSSINQKIPIQNYRSIHLPPPADTGR
jgi:hypothetical protein